MKAESETCNSTILRVCNDQCSKGLVYSSLCCLALSGVLLPLLLSTFWSTNDCNSVPFVHILFLFGTLHWCRRTQFQLSCGSSFNGNRMPPWTRKQPEKVMNSPAFVAVAFCSGDDHDSLPKMASVYCPHTIDASSPPFSDGRASLSKSSLRRGREQMGSLNFVSVEKKTTKNKEK